MPYPMRNQRYIPVPKFYFTPEEYYEHLLGKREFHIKQDGTINIGCRKNGGNNGVRYEGDNPLVQPTHTLDKDRPVAWTHPNKATDKNHRGSNETASWKNEGGSMTDQERERKKHLQNIRETFEFFGYDLSHLSDEDLEQRVIDTTKILSHCGISTKEAVERLRNVAMTTEDEGIVPKPDMIEGQWITK